MKNKKRMYSIALLFILIGSAIGIYLNYDNILAAGSKQNTLTTEEVSDFMSSTATKMSYVLQQELDIKSNKAYDTNHYLQINDSTISTDIINNWQESLSAWKNNWLYDESIKYYAKNTEGITIDNTTDDLANISTNKELQDKYSWYLTIHFDATGNITFTSNDQHVWSNDFKQQTNYLNQSIDPYRSNSSYLKTPTNMSITIAIDKEIKSTSMLYYYTSNLVESNVIVSAIPFVSIAIVVVSLFAFIFPIKLMKEQSPIKEILSIKIEILFFLLFFGFAGIIVFLVEFIKIMVDGSFLHLLNSVNNIDTMYPIFTSTINIGLWTVFLFLVAIVIFGIKFIFYKGFVTYIKENSCLGWVIRKSKSLITTILNFDLNEQDNQTILKIVLVNFIIITIISYFFVYGLMFSLLYSIILFMILKNKFMSIKKEYTTLLEATSELSKGNFDIQIPEDLGMFNSLRDEFTNIKDGFEKAVNEEVKSQKMKTELISNVSHDLKTPLTSIITYVDLLKDQTIDDIQKQQYLETIERNSLRLKNLIDDLFEVSKVNSGNIQLQVTNVDIIALLQQVQFECNDHLTKNSLELKTQYNIEKAIYALDSLKTYRIFENLLLNISKYAMPHTRVYIDVQETEKQITITFKNISASEITFDGNEIMERFVQGDKSRNSGGSGLGLAIAKSFTEVQGGTFHIDIDGDLFKATVCFYK